MNEIWRPIPGREGGYEVSSLGRVRSVDRTITRMTKRGPVRARLKGRVLATSMANSGYLVAMIGRARPYIHDLVLQAFIGQRPAGHQAAHWDGDRRNNTPGNLRWATPSQNNLDKARHGTLRKTTCRRGHPYTDLNTKLRPGRRCCITCLRGQRRRYRQARRAEGNTRPDARSTMRVHCSRAKPRGAPDQTAAASTAFLTDGFRSSADLNSFFGNR